MSIKLSQIEINMIGGSGICRCLGVPYDWPISTHSVFTNTADECRSYCCSGAGRWEWSMTGDITNMIANSGIC